MRSWLTHRPISVRTRLLVGMGSMLIPVVVLAVGAVSTLNISLDRFNQTEGIILRESFPTGELELLLIRVSFLASSAKESQSLSLETEFEQLSEDIEQKLRLLKSEGLRERRALSSEHMGLVTAIYTQWLEARVSGSQFFRYGSERSPQIRQVFIQDLEDTVVVTHRLKYLLDSWQYQTNLARAKEVRHNGFILLAVTCAVALIIVIFAVRALSRTILGPLKTLEQAMSRFSEGELSHRIQLETQDEFAQLAQVFNQMAMKLEQSQTDLQTLATLDGLTGVYNRREFNRWLHIELEKAQRNMEPLSLMMVDIDHFKKLNDNYGHQSGDIALQYVSTLLTQNVRPGDIVARYGGEEFAVILPQATEDEAFVIAERIRQAIETQSVEVVDCQVVKMTASLGLATFPSTAQTEETLLGAADRALYQAKESGRNQVQHMSRTLV